MLEALNTEKTADMRRRYFVTKRESVQCAVALRTHGDIPHSYSPYSLLVLWWNVFPTTPRSAWTLSIPASAALRQVSSHLPQQTTCNMLTRNQLRKTIRERANVVGYMVTVILDMIARTTEVGSRMLINAALERSNKEVHGK